MKAGLTCAKQTVEEFSWTFFSNILPESTVSALFSWFMMASVSFKKPLKKFFRKKQSGDSDEETETKASLDAETAKDGQQDVIVVAAAAIKPLTPPEVQMKFQDNGVTLTGGTLQGSSSVSSKLSFDDGDGTFA